MFERGCWCYSSRHGDGSCCVAHHVGCLLECCKEKPPSGREPHVRVLRVCIASGVLRVCARILEGTAAVYSGSGQSQQKRRESLVHYASYVRAYLVSGYG